MLAQREVCRERLQGARNGSSRPPCPRSTASAVEVPALEVLRQGKGPGLVAGEAAILLSLGGLSWEGREVAGRCRPSFSSVPAMAARLQAMREGGFGGLRGAG